MSNKVRKPRQARSIETKNKIIEAGYKLFAEKGYFRTNTAEIAKEADVSTGIIYGYFRDKRDILLDVLDIYIKTIYEPIFKMFDNIKKPLNFEFILDHAIFHVLEIHKNNAEIHESLHSLTSTDEAVKRKFDEIETRMTDIISDNLIKIGYEKDKLYEKVHLSINILQAFAHECIYDNHKNVNYEIMQEIVKNILLKLFE